MRLKPILIGMACLMLLSLLGWGVVLLAQRWQAHSDYLALKTAVRQRLSALHDDVVSLEAAARAAGEDIGEDCYGASERTFIEDVLFLVALEINGDVGDPVAEVQKLSERWKPTDIQSWTDSLRPARGIAARAQQGDQFGASYAVQLAEALVAALLENTDWLAERALAAQEDPLSKTAQRYEAMLSLRGECLELLSALLVAVADADSPPSGLCREWFTATAELGDPHSRARQRIELCGAVAPSCPDVAREWLPAILMDIGEIRPVHLRADLLFRLGAIERLLDVAGSERETDALATLTGWADQAGSRQEALKLLITYCEIARSWVDFRSLAGDDEALMLRGRKWGQSQRPRKTGDSPHFRLAPLMFTNGAA